jgi:uridylate kinase
MEHRIPIVVFNFKKKGNIERAVRRERIGTRIVPESDIESAERR